MAALALLDSLINKISSSTDETKEEENESNRSRIPITNLKDCANPDQRYKNLIESFSKQYNGISPDFIVRSPGRVNLIGEHIDYCGYDVLPMAVEKEILFAVKIIDSNKEENMIELANTESKFKPISINLSSEKDTTIILGHENRHWSIYFLAAYKGVIKNYASEINIKRFKSLRIMVDGNVPKGSGLSSSSAFVCGSAVSLLYSNLNGEYFTKTLTQSDVAKFCIKCEQEVGVMSGGMDQTICMTANKGYAKHIQFIPKLNADDVQLPSSKKVRWIIANCLLEHKLQDEGGTQNYNTRVVECRLSSLLFAKLLGIKQWREIKTFRDIQDTLGGIKLPQLISKAKQLLKDEAYSIEILEKELDCKPLEDIMKDLSRGESVLKNLRNLGYKLPLKSRTLHVYGEANRVLEFKNVCDNDRNEMKLGELMSKSHESCRDQYECSCKELDALQTSCIKGGSLGSRLTGAGWGGCCVSLVPIDKVEKFKTYLKDNYYNNIKDVPDDAYFTTSPGAGLSVLLN